MDQTEQAIDATCGVSGCGREIEYAGYCKGHNQRLRATGKLGGPTFRRYVRTTDDIEAKLRTIGWTIDAAGCWIWNGRIGSKSNGMYGVVDLGKKSQLVHRVAHELWIGAIPEGHVVMHRCDTPRCINPAHLRTGTQEENLHDRDNKGHHANTKKTHCNMGHEYSPENTSITVNAKGRIHRRCKTCARRWWREAKARKAQAEAAESGA